MGNFSFPKIGYKKKRNILAGISVILILTWIVLLVCQMLQVMSPTRDVPTMRGLLIAWIICTTLCCISLFWLWNTLLFGGPENKSGYDTE
jgi:hypothetical protein